MKTIMVLDGNNLVFRAYYALPPMQDGKGRPTNAVYGFISMLLRLMADYGPDSLAVAFDMHGPTFRHEKYADYKAGRKETPQDLVMQFPMLKELLDKMGVARIEQQGYEADDILGTLGEAAANAGQQALLVSGDRDVFQLIRPGVQVLYANKGVIDMTKLDAQGLQERFGYTPDRVTDLKALMGDASDNIPGIVGVGEKTAMNLIGHFPTLEEALERPEEVLKGAMLKKVVAGAESARFSKWLATIKCDVPIDVDIDSYLIPDMNAQAVYDALVELNMPSLADRIKRSAPAPEGEEAKNAKRGAWQELCYLRDEKEARAFLAQLPKGDVALTLWPEIEVAVGGVQGRLCLRRDLLEEGLQEEEAIALLGEALVGRSAYYYDRKRVRRALSDRDVAVPPSCGDAMIAGYLLFQVEGAQSLSPLAQRMWGEEGEGAAVLHDLCVAMHARLRDEDMERLYREVELPLTDVLYDMEREGFTIDTDALRVLGEQYEAQMKGIEQEIYDLAGEVFNILSPKQLGVILFEKLELPATKKIKSGYSTDSGVLEGIEHPVAGKVLEYRTLAKLKSTYVDGLLSVVGKDGKVHTTLNQTVTATGRISSTEPNLQNIPVRTEQGRVIRRVFIPDAQGEVLVDADYSQIELRVLAHMSGDPNMQEAFHLGQDIHQRTAAEIHGLPIEQVTSAMRSAAKAVNFGVVYGISDFGLARNTGITRGEARHFIDTYFERYPKVRAFMDACITQGKTQGYVTTMMGRRRYLPELSSSNFNVRSFGERAAMNTPIQGTAADIIKLAMVKVAQALREEGLAARLILQVHDELIIDAPLEEEDKVKAILRREMESAIALSVPMEVDIHTGANWEEAK